VNVFIIIIIVYHFFLLLLLLSLLLSITETFPSNQVARAEFLQELLSAGIEVGKATKLRRWLEGRMGLPLLSDDHLLRQYLGPTSGKNSRNFHTLGYEMGNFQKLVFFHTQMVLFQTINFF
jgi:hypothetical protein